MNTPTHCFIALFIKNTLKRNYNIRIPTFWFLFGNLKPDYSSYLITAPHYRKISNNFIKDQIFQITKYNSYSNTTPSNCNRDLAIKLGVITHYLSDFFCLPHTENFGGNLFNHYLYERKLYKCLRSNKEIITNSTESAFKTSVKNFEERFFSLEKMQERYNGSKPSFYLDIFYAILVSMFTIICVLNIDNISLNKSFIVRG